jgi:phosphonate transport system ATP-binding protein
VPRVSESVLELTGLSVDLSSHQVLKNINLRVDRGQRLAVIGKSGAGKSTLLGAMVGTPVPTKGEVSLFEANLSSISKHQLRILRQKTGHVSQSYDLVEDLSLFENVLLGDFASYKFPRFFPWMYRHGSKVKALELLERFGLAQLANQRAGTLSGGESQRAAIVRALMCGPEIIFADEPISALDVDSSARVLSDLKEVSSSGVAVVAALHQIDSALDWATDIVLLANGEIVAQGPAEQFTLDELKKKIAKG